MAKLLIIEEDDVLLNDMRKRLSLDLHLVESFCRGDQVLHGLAVHEYSLIVVDLELSGTMTGLEVCRLCRQSSQLPIICLSDKTHLSAKELAFAAGTDDYLTKPFQVEELCLRVNALLRRPAVYVPDLLSAGSLTLERRSLTVSCNGRRIDLSRLEFALLELFIRHPGQLLSQATLLKTLWSSSKTDSSHALRTCLKKLRSKIEQTGISSPIKNVYGEGYKFDCPETHESGSRKDRIVTASAIDDRAQVWPGRDENHLPYSRQQSLPTVLS